MSRLNKSRFFILSIATVLGACSGELPGDQGKIIGRWEELGGVFTEKDTISYYQWYEFMPEGKAISYAGDFDYKLDTVAKKLTATITMKGTDNVSKYVQPFFEKDYQLKGDTLILRRVTEHEIRKVLIRKKEQ